MRRTPRPTQDFPQNCNLVLDRALRDQYIDAAGNSDLRREIRDKIIYRQLGRRTTSSSVISERTLASSNNAFSLSSDTAVASPRRPLGPVVGGATTKAALAAASAFIIGTKTAVDKDLSTKRHCPP